MTTMAKETDAFSHMLYTSVYSSASIQERFILKLRDQQITPKNIAKSDIDFKNQ